MANYRVLVHYDPDRSVFVARTPELEHCNAEGATRAEAIHNVEEEIQAQVANMRERGKNPPAALDDDAALSGQLAAKVSRTLHRDLTWQARLEGVELDQLVGEILAQGLDARRQRRRPPGPNQNAQPDRNEGRNEGGDRGNNRDDRRGPGNDRGGRGQGRYHAIMDDRATFVEYVRGLEQGQQGRGPRPGGGGGGPGGGGGGGRRRGGFRPGPGNDRGGGGGEGGTPPAGDEGGGA